MTSKLRFPIAAARTIPSNCRPSMRRHQIQGRRQINHVDNIVPLDKPENSEAKAVPVVSYASYLKVLVKGIRIAEANAFAIYPGQNLQHACRLFIISCPAPNHPILRYIHMPINSHLPYLSFMGGARGIYPGPQARECAKAFPHHQCHPQRM